MSRKPSFLFMLFICMFCTACNGREYHEPRKFSIVSETSQSESSESITPETRPSSAETEKPGTEKPSMVYITKTGKRYHYSHSCAGDSSFECGLEEALEKGLTPCKKCAGK